MNKCQGCGAIIQNVDENKEGYALSLDHKLCNRCFKIQNYNDYQQVSKDNSFYTSILKKVSETDDLILLIVDLFQVYDLEEIKPYLNSNVILVLTKRDLLPQRLYEEKIKNYFDKFKIDFLDKIIVSSKNHYQFDELYNKILKYKKSKNVYVVGYTNAGKSTLINEFLTLYSENKQKITTSSLPSTTLNTMTIEVSDDLVFIDTPGLLVNNSILDKIDSNTFKKIIPNKRIKPIVYQVKCQQYFKIDDLLYLKVEDKNNIVFYFSNSLNISRLYKNKEPDNLVAHLVKIPAKHDILINGLGFIKFINEAQVTIFLPEGVSYIIRPSVI